MGSTVLHKSPSSFIAFVYGFLLISFLSNIPHVQGAAKAITIGSLVNSKVGAPPPPPPRHDSNSQRRPPNGVQHGASRVHGSPLGHAPNAVKQGSPPNLENTRQKTGENCTSSYRTQNRGCAYAVNP